ncbi:MAG: DAK2 domain-containing protein [Clostridia bacterium]
MSSRFQTVDTGDNMLLTMMGGVDAPDCGETSVCEVSRQAANGMLLCARGNSGVILSQLFDGIAEGLDGLDSADNVQIANAMRCGCAARVL